MAQSVPISGTVLSDDGTPLAGVTVSISGTTRAAVTDIRANSPLTQMQGVCWNLAIWLCHTKD